MKSVIWKYKLPFLQGHPVYVRLPVMSQVLRAGAIGEQLFVWVQSSGERLRPVVAGDPNSGVAYKFLVLPTGHRFDDAGWTFLETVLMPVRTGETLVWHIYYTMAPP